MLVRRISTYRGLPTTKQISYIDNQACQMTIEEIITSKINDLIYEMMGEQFQQKLDMSMADDPIEEDKPSKKKKNNKKKKKQADKEEVKKVEEKDPEEEKTEVKSKKKNKKKKKKTQEPAEEDKTIEDRINKANEDLDKVQEQLEQESGEFDKQQPLISSITENKDGKRTVTLGTEQSFIDIVKNKDPQTYQKIKKEEKSQGNKDDIIKGNLMENKKRVNNLKDQDLLSKSVSVNSLQELNQQKKQLEFLKNHDQSMQENERKQLRHAYDNCQFSEGSSLFEFNVSVNSEEAKVQEEFKKAKEWGEQSKGLLSGHPNNRYKDELTDQFRYQINQMESEAWDNDGEEAKEMGAKYHKERELKKYQDKLGMRQRTNESIERSKKLNENDEILAEQQKLFEQVKDENQPSQGFTGLTDLKEEQLDRNRQRYQAEADKVITVDDTNKKSKKNRRKGPKKKKVNEENKINPEFEQALLKNERLLEAHLKAEKKAESDEEEVNVMVGNDDAYFDDNWYENDLDRPGTPDKTVSQWDFLAIANQTKEINNKELPKKKAGQLLHIPEIHSPEQDQKQEPIDLSAIIVDFEQEVEPEAEEISNMITEEFRKKTEVSIQKSKENYKEKQLQNKFVSDLTNKLITDCIQGQEDEPLIPIKGKKKSKQEKRKDAKIDQNRRKQEQAKIKEQEQEKKKKEQQDKKIKNEKKEEEQEAPQIEEEREQIKLPTLQELGPDVKASPTHIKRDNSINIQKKIQTIKRESSYGEARPPQRFSSRGTSKASSKKESDPDLDDLDGLFPKQYRAPQEATIGSINESLNNSSKKNSLESNQNQQSTAVDPFALTQALKNQQRQESKEKDKQRSASLNNRKSPPTIEVKPQQPQVNQQQKKQKAEKKKKEKTQDTSPAPGVIEILRAEPPKQNKKKKEQQPQPQQSKKQKKKDDVKEEKKEQDKKEDEPKEKEIQKVNLKSQLFTNQDNMNFIPQQQNPLMFNPMNMQPPMMNQMVQQPTQMDYPMMSNFDQQQLMQMQFQQQQQQNMQSMTIDMMRITIQNQQQMPQPPPMMNMQRDENMQPMFNQMQAQFSQLTLNNSPQQQMFNQMQQMAPPNLMMNQAGHVQNPYMFPTMNQDQYMAMQRMYQQQPPPNESIQQMFKAQQQMFQQQQFQEMPHLYMNQNFQIQQFQNEQFKLQTMRNLRIQGYILNQQEYDLLYNQLSHQELGLVHEFYEVLDAQILKLQQDQEQKLSKTEKLRRISFQLISDKIKQIYSKKGLQNQVKVEMYGSMATGLAIDSSDLDILVHDFVDHNSPRYIQMNRSQLIEEMQTIHNSLNSISSITQNTLIDTASVPVIKLKINLVELCENYNNDELEVDPKELANDEEISILNVDITLDEPKKADDPSKEHLGLQCCKYIKNQIKDYSKMKTLVLVFKKFLSLKGLNRPFSGGLSSYSLIQMTLALLKQEQDLIDQLQEQNFGRSDLSVGMIFKHFIHEFGNTFNPQQKGIDQDGKILDRESFFSILHAPQCNLNQKYEEFESDKCTCGIDQYPEKRNDDNLGKLIQQLITGQQSEDIKEERKRAHTSQGPQLIIVDPLNKFNNIGKSSYNFASIQEEFRQVYMRLNEELIKFVKVVAARPSSQAAEPIDMIDGLIPRVLQIDYKISQQEEIKAIQPTEERKQNERENPTPQVATPEEDLKPRDKKKTQQAKQSKKKKQQTQTKQRKK